MKLPKNKNKDQVFEDVRKMNTKGWRLVIKDIKG